LTKFLKKTWKFPNKKGTFDVNLVFTATLACTKRALFITKKGTFSPLKKWGGGGTRAPPVPTPLTVVVLPGYMVQPWFYQAIWCSHGSTRIYGTVMVLPSYMV
jgi:hypothetical protein